MTTNGATPPDPAQRAIAIAEAFAFFEALEGADPGGSTVKTKQGRGQKARLASLLDALRSKGWEPGQAAGWSAAEVERNYGILLQSDTAWKNLPLVCVAVELLAAHQPDTVRGNMYLVVSAGWLPDTSRKSYSRIQRLLNRLRLNGTLDFSWIVDNIRSTIKPSSWSGLADFAETVAEAYRKDFWAELPEYVEVIVEKDTVAGKVAPVTREFDVALHPIRGYNSTTFAYDIAKHWERIDKPITIYYVGDHDPSGRDLERDIREKATRFSGKDVSWVRLAVNLDHFGEFAIRPLAAKKSDKRYAGFVARYGEDCAEVEAIPATELRAMVRSAIESHIPSGAWQKLQEVERLEKEQWEGFMERMKGP
jgi:hypothetical protein